MSKEFRIGLIALVSGVVLYYGFNFLKGQDFLSKTDYYYTIYNNIGTLTPSNPVKINGVQVGKVTKIKLLPDRNNKVLVQFDVQEDIVVGDGAVAKLVGDIIAGSSIVLSVGNQNQALVPGDTIESDVDSGLEAIIESTQTLENNLSLAANKFNQLLDEFEGFGDKLGRLMDELQLTLESTNSLINQNRSSIDGLLTKSNNLLKNLDDRVAQLEPILTKTSQAMDSLDSESIGNSLKELESLLAELNELTSKINDGEGSLGKMMSSDSVYNNLNKLLIDLDKLAIHFNQYPKDFLKPLGRKHHKLKGVTPTKDSDN